MKDLGLLPTPPDLHEYLLTEDGSVTIFSKRFDEAAHSSHGAIDETKLRFIQGCDLKNRLKPNELHTIFEVGFGLGLGFLETFTLWNNLNQPPLHFITCEIDTNLVKWCCKNLKLIYADKYPSEAFDLLQNVTFENNLATTSIKNFKLSIYLGDILEHAPIISEKYFQKIDSIFQDAYSPKKNPTLWSVDWFKFLKKISNDKTILSTYSSSTSVRKNLLEAGFGIKNGPGFGKKKSSTVAFGNGVSENV